MFCRNCGAELPEGSRFCPKCGSSLTDPSVSRPSVSSVQGLRPPTYLVLSILVTVCCCVVFGIIGIVYAAKVDPAWNAGRYEEARAYSRKARNWALAGAIISIVFGILYVILVLAGLFSWDWWYDNSYLYTACLS